LTGYYRGNSTRVEAKTDLIGRDESRPALKIDDVVIQNPKLSRSPEFAATERLLSKDCSGDREVGPLNSIVWYRGGSNANLGVPGFISHNHLGNRVAKPVTYRPTRQKTQKTLI